MPIKEWRCIDCKTLLGIIPENKDYIRIKYKDLYIRVNGEVEIICRKCGKENKMILNKFRI